MGVEAQTIGAVGKGAGFFASPVGRLNIIIASIFFIVLLFVGVSQSIEQKSLYPVWHQTLERVISADTHLGQQVDILSEDNPLRPSKIYTQGAPAYVWFWIVWWFETASCFFMIYFFIWLIYGFWTMTNNSLIFRNIFLTLFIYIIISFVSGMIIFSIGLAGKCIPDDKNLIFDKLLENSYPFHGTMKFIKYFVNSENMQTAYAWTQTSIGSALTGIESESNQTNNLSG